MGKQVDKNDFWFIEKNPITKVGVYPYLGKQISQDCEPDKIYWVLRPKEELFRKETLDSLRLIPLIDGHTMIGKDFTAPEDKGLDGTLGDNVSHDTDTIYNDLKIISNKMKDEIKNGKKELSLGYFCRYDKQPGTYKGQRYDYVQRDIIANHLALVDKGRMGADVRVYDSKNIPEGEAFAMDSIDIAIDKDEDIEWITVRGTHIPIKKGESKEQAVKKFLESKKEKDNNKEYRNKLFREATSRVEEKRKNALQNELKDIQNRQKARENEENKNSSFKDKQFMEATKNVEQKRIAEIQKELGEESKGESKKKEKPTLKKGKYEISIDPNKALYEVKDTETGKVKQIDASDNDGLWSYLEVRGIEDLPDFQELQDLTQKSVLANETTTKNTSKREMKTFVTNKAFFDDRIDDPVAFKNEMKRSFEGIYGEATEYEREKEAKFDDIYEMAVKRYLKATGVPKSQSEHKNFKLIKRIAKYADKNFTLLGKEKEGFKEFLGEVFMEYAHEEEKDARGNMSDLTNRAIKQFREYNEELEESGQKKFGEDSKEYKNTQGEGKMEKEKKVAVADEDKRKLIDEIGGILKDKGLDDEIIRTVIGKAEKIAYNKSEAGDEGEEGEEEVIEEEKDKKPAKDKCGKDEDKKEEKKGMDEGEIFKMLARKEKLAKEVETVIGTFDHSEMTENQVAKYACDKLELGAVEGQELATLKGYLKAVASSPKVTYGYKTVAADGGIQKEDAEFEKFSKGE